MTEHNRSSLDKKDEDRLPTGYEWVPITQWRLGHLEIFTHIPLQRTQIHFRPINVGLTPAEHQKTALQLHEPASTPAPRLQEADAATRLRQDQHRAMLDQLQDLNDRLHHVYLSLPANAKQTLMNHLSATQTAIWTFSEKINQKDRAAKPSLDNTTWPQTEFDLTTQLRHLKDRLAQISEAARPDEDKKTQVAHSDSEHGDDGTNWHADCLTLSSLIEATLVALVGAPKSGSTNPWSGPVPPLTASPGAVKMQQRSVGYTALAEEKKREKRRERAKQAMLDAQAEMRITAGAQPMQAKEDSRFES